MAPADGEKIEWLLRALRHGNADALDGIYALLGGRMLALARGIVCNRADAEDVVSESFLKLARGIGGYRPGTNGCAFVMRIVRNTAYDLLRRRKVRAEEDIDAFFHLTDERYRPERMEGALVLEEARRPSCAFGTQNDLLPLLSRFHPARDRQRDGHEQVCGTAARRVCRRKPPPPSECGTRQRIRPSVRHGASGGGNSLFAAGQNGEEKRWNNEGHEKGRKNRTGVPQIL